MPYTPCVLPVPRLFACYGSPPVPQFPSHPLPSLLQADHAYKVFNEKKEGCIKVVLKPPQQGAGGVGGGGLAQEPEGVTQAGEGVGTQAEAEAAAAAKLGRMGL